MLPYSERLAHRGFLTSRSFLSSMSGIFHLLLISLGLMVVCAGGATGREIKWDEEAISKAMKDPSKATYFRDLRKTTKLWKNLKLEIEDVKYYLFTKENRNIVYELIPGNVTLLQTSPYSVHRPTKVFIHGWLRDWTHYAFPFIEAYILYTDVNLIFIDWGKYSSYNYLYTIFYAAPFIGNTSAALIKDLLNYGTNPDDVHIIGHSIGAHIASHIASCTDEKFGRITGLDPAGPGYEMFKLRQISKEDAQFVDVIHTNTYFIGDDNATGHVDFFPNGGALQNGCGFFNVKCHHRRSILYYIESINPSTEFYALQCSDYDSYQKRNCTPDIQVLMGEYVNTRINGSYYLDTNDKSPYAKGNHGT